MATAISTPNIAFIKYWGNRKNTLRIPVADSLSMTLSEPSVEITIDHADTLKIQSSTIGEEREIAGKHLDRFQKVIDLAKEYLGTLGMADALPGELSIRIDSHIPPAVGLASSAAVFSCLARAIAALITEEKVLTDEQVSIIARLGSGSAARSVMGGFVALRAGEGESIDAAKAVQIADEHHWLLHDIVVIPSREEKKVGSTEGHALAATSPYFAARIEAITTRRQQECIDAILRKDFEKLQHMSEEDALDMHHVMETSNPPLKYLSQETHHIVGEVKALRETKHLPVLFTMDAGPTVHLVCTDEAAEEVRAFASAQKGCTIFESQVGPGARVKE
ncbi:MAG: diphosphomevalonate decarboxylase [Candidatus Peribacteraceae bacterium]|nr:diphosphomevalonate decarboxylase [Candidatus Peribacteraceae bacterium]